MQTALTDTTLRIVFADELISTKVAALRAELITHLERTPAVRALIADIAHCRTVDSQGLNLLIALLREAERRRLSFKVENPNDDVRRLLSLLRLDERFGLSAPAHP